MATGPDLEINIKTKADLKGAKDLEASLKTQIAALKKLGQDATAAEAQLKKVQAAIKASPEKGGALGGILGGLKGIKEQGGAAATAINGIASTLTGPFAAAAAIVGSLAAAFRSVTAAVEEYAEAEERATSMDAALAQQGQLTDENREKFQALTGELQKLTAIADDEWAGVLARLTQFGSTPESVGMDAAAVKNLAGILNGDLQSAALMVGKALQGNFTAFGRWGIAVDQNATQAKKLEQLYRELAERGGGQLEARAKTLTGQWRGMKLATSDLMEAFGGIIARTGVLQGVTRTMTDAFEWWGEVLSDTIPKVEGLTNAQTKTVDVQEELEASGKRYEKILEGQKLEADKLADALGRVRSESEAIKRRQDEQNSARMALELAIVDDQQKRGTIKEPTAIARRAAIREKYELLKEQAALKNDLKQIQVNADELKLAVAREKQAKAEVAALEARKKAALNYNKTAAGKVDSLIKGLDAEDERLAGQESDMSNTLQGGQIWAAERGVSEEGLESVRAARKKTQALRQRYEARRRGLGPDAENVTLIDAALGRAKDQLKGDSSTAETLGRQLPAKNQEIAADAASRHTVEGLGAATNAVQGDSSRQLISVAARAAASTGELNASLLNSFRQIDAQNRALQKEVATLMSQIQRSNR